MDELRNATYNLTICGVEVKIVMFCGKIQCLNYFFYIKFEEKSNNKNGTTFLIIISYI